MSRRLAAALLVAAGTLLPAVPASACETVPCHAIDYACGMGRAGLACAWAGRVCTALGPECA